MITKKNATQLMITGDPLALYIATKNYKNRLRRFVDNFFVGIHTWHYYAPHDTNPSHSDLKSVEELFTNLTKDESDIKFVYPTEGTTQHGTMLNELVKVVYDDCKDNLLITETDDFFVNIDLLESHVDAMNRGEYDFLGEPRGCTNNSALIEFERKVVREDNVFVNKRSQMVDHVEAGEFAHYWPTHFLIKKKFVNRDDHFESFGVGGFGDELGSSINNKEINYRGRKFFVSNTCGDTFVKFSIDMMSRINKGYEYIAAPWGHPDTTTLGYLGNGLVNTPNYTLPLDAFEKFAIKFLSLHTGSGSALQLFPIITNKDAILKQSICIQVKQFAQSKDEFQLLELYRRFKLYQAGFEAIKDDVEFAPFRDRCIQNFGLLDEIFNEVNIEQILKNRGNWLIPMDIYVNTFKYIVGKI